MMSKWWLGGHRVWTFKVLLLPYGTSRRNWTYRSILPNATTISHNRVISPPEIVFFTTIPVSKFVKDLGVQTDNMFSTSARCTEAANKARRLIYMIRRSLQNLSKSAFIPLYGALVRPHLEYGMPACSPNLVADINHLERIQRLAARLETGMHHLP